MFEFFTVCLKFVPIIVFKKNENNKGYYSNTRYQYCLASFSSILDRKLFKNAENNILKPLSGNSTTKDAVILKFQTDNFI